MSDGGLLQKAMDVQQPADEIVAVAASNPIETNDPVGIGKILGTILFGMVLPFFFLMWFGGIIPVVSSSVVSLVVILISISFVWWRLDGGLPSMAGGAGINRTVVGSIFMALILLLGTPALLSIVLTGDMTLGEIEFDNDGSEMTIKIRQNGGSGSHDATIIISQSGNEVLNQVQSFNINREDSRGDYGEITINVVDFYSSNALPLDENRYVISVSVGGATFSENLDSNLLTRTITGAESSATASLSTNADDCGDKERCVIGVALTGSAGLAGSVGYPPAGLPYADYSMQVTMYYDGDNVAIDYPSITVDSTTATWDSNGGEWGSGSGIIGDGGSSLPLGGSEYASDVEAEIIPISAWEENDYGCYTVKIEITQQSPWSDATSLTFESFYLFEKTGNQENGESETWTESTVAC
tara:strand:- start:318 stop:1556 length:1239 start_codon:yes stop_codon:yes gene_type:complete